MIIEVNGQQVEVDDSFASLPPEQQQAELAHITQVMSPPASSVEVRGATEADLINPLTAAGVGVVTGELAGPMVNKGVEAVRKGAPAAAAALNIPGSAGGAAPGQKFAAKTGYGSGPGYTVQEVVEHQKAQAKPIGKGKISGKIAGNSPMNIDKMMMLEAEQKAEAARRAAALAPTGIMSKLPESVQAAGRFIGGATQSGVTPWLGRGLAGGATGFQGADAYNRFQQGDYPGAAISGLGALGSAASFVPHPATRVGGAAVGISAEALNMYLDSLKKKVEQQPAPAPAQAPMPQMAAGGAIQHFAGKGSGAVVAGGLQNIAKKFQKLPTKQVKVSEALEPHVGSYLGLTQSDNFGVHGNIPMGPPTRGQTLHPSERMGGNKFSGFQRTNPAHQESDVVWMNDTEEHANDMMNRNTFNGKPVIWTTRLGTPNQLVSNKTVFNNVMDEFYNQKYTPEQYELLNNRVKFLAEKGKFKGDFDIRDRFAMQEYGADTFHGRRALGDMIGEGIGVGKSKHGIMLPNYEDILKSHRDPATQGLGTNALGQRLFSVNDTPSKFSTDFHPDYRYTVHGTDEGIEFPFSSPDKLTPDFYNKYVAKNNQAPAGNGWFGYMNDPQEISPQLIKALKKEGLAEGGKVQHFQVGKRVLSNLGKETLSLLKKSPEDLLAARQAMTGFVQKQNPILAKATDAYRLGKISHEEFQDIIAKHYKPNILGKVPDKMSPYDIAVAIGPGKAQKGIVDFNVEIPHGAEYTSRLDIPGYEATGQNVGSIVLPSKKTVYGQAEHLGDVGFESDPTKAMRVALGTKEQALTPGAVEFGNAKSPFAVVKGKHLATDPDEIRRAMEFYTGAPEWKEIGMNPYAHSQFFDKKTMQPAWNSDEVLKYGNYVLAKDPEMTHWMDPRLAVDAEKVGGVPGIKFAAGGLTALKKKK